MLIFDISRKEEPTCCVGVTNQNRESKELAEFLTFPQPAIFQE
jgi:hypothetical protein